MTNLQFLLICLITFSCSTSNKVTELSSNEKNPILDIKLLEFELIPGEAKYVSLPVPRTISKHELYCGKTKISTKYEQDKLKSFIAVPYGYKDEFYNCSLVSENNKPFNVIKIKVKQKKYKTSYIKVPKRKVDLEKSDIDWYLEDKKVLKKVYSELELEKKYFDSSFLKPLNSKITSPYGAKRIFNNKKSSWHNGIDFRAKVGTPIPSTNKGKVILVRHLFFNGKTVLIDHGMGIVSLYCHLSDYSVKEGDIVDKGDIIGLGGNTGRSSGPHLHWGIRLHGSWINGFSLIQESGNQEIHLTPY